MIRNYKLNILRRNENQEYEKEIVNRIRSLNAKRGKTLTLLVVFLEVLLIIGYDLQNIAQNGLSNNYALEYLLLHMFLLLSSLTGFVLSYFYLKNPEHKLFTSISYDVYALLIAISFLTGITLINGIDQTHTNSISMFLFFILIISLFTLLKPKHYIIVYSIIYVLFVVTMYYFQSDSVTMVSNTVNGFLAVATSLFIAFLNYTFYYDYFLKTIKLEVVTEQLEHLSETDHLTEIPNRRRFNENLQNELARSSRTNQPFSLLMIDIDQFKNVNDTHGHLVGDSVLKDISSELKKIIRIEDTLARYGGEEFVIILTNTNLQDAQTKAEQLRQEVESSKLSHDVFVTISIGLTEYKKEDTIESIIHRTDIALYNAKDSGRNAVKVKE